MTEKTAAQEEAERLAKLEVDRIAAKQKAADRKAAITSHATYGSGPANAPTLEEQRDRLRAAIDTEIKKPLHKRQDVVLANLRQQLRNVERNIAAS